MNCKVEKSKIKGEINCPSNKSYTHRGIFLASLAGNNSKVENVLLSADTKATIEACKKFGAVIEVNDSDIIVKKPIKIGINVPEINTENSGTTIRIAIGIASLFSEESQKVSYLIKEKKSPNWPNEEILSKEFESLGFYISSHPLNAYKDILEQYKVKLFKDFEEGHESEAFIVGTIMSVKEKKTSKGNSFAIIKFSDLSKVFELFLFSEILEANRKKLVEGKSFLLTVIKDKENQENRFRRINVRKIVSLEDITKLNYNHVHIEIDKIDNLDKLYETIKDKGDSKINILVNTNDKNYLFDLKDKRKFDYETLKDLNKEQFIKKIRV